jgi:hypothetical protein
MAAKHRYAEVKLCAEMCYDHGNLVVMPKALNIVVSQLVEAQSSMASLDTFKIRW